MVAEHLKVLGDDALQSLASLITALALNPATFPATMMALLRRCRLALLEKLGSTDEHRKHHPIAVPEVVNKLVSKRVFARQKQQASSFLAPLQLVLAFLVGANLPTMV